MADRRPAVLAFFHNIVAGREAEFEEWFQHEHLPERIAIPGFLMGRRYEAVSADQSYFHFYVIRSVKALKSDAYIARVNEPTPLTRTVMSEITKNVFRTVCRRTFRLGAMRGAAAVTVRLADRSTEAELKTAIEELIRDRAVACGEIWQSVDPVEFSVSAEERFAAVTAGTKRACWWKRYEYHRLRKSRWRWLMTFTRPTSASIAFFARLPPASSPLPERPDVACWHETDVLCVPTNVCSWWKAAMQRTSPQRPILTPSRHRGG